MQSTNKVLCNFNQGLTELEKYTARKNISAVSGYDIQSSSITHTVTQTEAQNGQFSFSRTGANTVGIHLLSIYLYISPDGTKPNDNVIPLWITVRRNLSGGGHESIIGYTADLVRLENNGPWQCRTDVVAPTVHNSTSMDFIIDFEDLKIPQNTPVECRVTGVLIGNIDPST